MSLKQQSLSSIVWTFADAIFIKGLFFIATIYLARLLGPEEFGLIGMISIFIAIGTTLVDSGLSSSLIRAQEVSEVDYSSVFYLNVLMSIVVYALIYNAAPYIAIFYKQVLLTDIVRVYCLTFVISAFTSVHIAKLVKNMRFKKLMMLSIPGTIVGIIVSVIMGINGFGVWSIVSLYMSMQITQAFMLWVFAGWRPKFMFSTKRAKYHYLYGYKLMLAGLINTVFDNVYNIVIGKYFSAKSLGYFERARTFNDYPVTVITSIINKVSFPMLSKIQDQREKVSQIYRQLIKLSFFIIAPLMICLAAVARPLFTLILGSEWLPAVNFFQILCISGILFPIHSFNINVLKVYGRSDLFLKLEIVKKLIVTVSLVFMFSFGLVGIVWSSVITSVLALFINMFYSGKMMDYQPKEQLYDMLPVIIVVGVMFLGMSYLVNYLVAYSVYLQILIPVFSGFIFYIVTNYFIKSSTFLFALSIIKK